MAGIWSIPVRCDPRMSTEEEAGTCRLCLTEFRLEPVTSLLAYRDRRSYGCVFEKLPCHSLWYANATVRCSKRWNISLVHRVTAPEEHRVRHPLAIEMGSLWLLVLT